MTLTGPARIAEYVVAHNSYGPPFLGLVDDPPTDARRGAVCVVEVPSAWRRLWRKPLRRQWLRKDHGPHDCPGPIRAYDSAGTFDLGCSHWIRLPGPTTCPCGCGAHVGGFIHGDLNDGGAFIASGAKSPINARNDGEDGA